MDVLVTVVEVLRVCVRVVVVVEVVVVVTVDVTAGGMTVVVLVAVVVEVVVIVVVGGIVLVAVEAVTVTVRVVIGVTRSKQMTSLGYCFGDMTAVVALGARLTTVLEAARAAMISRPLILGT